MSNIKYILDNNNKYIYKVIEVHHDSIERFNRYELALVCGIDYISYSNKQDWVKADRFIKEVQYNHITHFPEYDGKLEYYLESLNMEVIDTLPMIYD